MGNFIVTGGNGYIGSHMCKYLHKAGHKVYIIDNFSTSPKYPTHDFGTFFEGDIADGQTLKKIVKETSIDGVFHFAAHSIVPDSEKKPLDYYYENVVKSFIFVKDVIAQNISKIVFSSTCAVYGIPETERLYEEHPQTPINTYGQTKKIIEIFLKDLANKKLIDVLILRYFNVAGSSPDGDIGENHFPESHLIPKLTLDYLNCDIKNFQIFGNTYPTRDGTCVRDYIHVEDLVRAHYLGYEYLTKNSGLQNFNLGSEVGQTVIEVIDTFEKVTGSKIVRNFAPERAGDPAILLANSQKIRDFLNFTPKYNLEDAITHTLNYLKKRKIKNGN